MDALRHQVHNTYKSVAESLIQARSSAPRAL